MSKATCAQAGCTQGAVAKGLCRPHYTEQRIAAAGPCSVDGCDRPKKYRSFCSVHYGRQRRRGTTELIMWRKPPLRRFLSKVVIDRNGCWLWTSTTSPDGYGCYTLNRYKSGRAHRVAHELFVGPIPDGYEVDHLCCVRRCVNPRHLEAVTSEENKRRQWDRARAAGRKR